MAKVPEWFPGAGFKRIGREWNVIVEEMISAPFQFAKDQMVNDTLASQSTLEPSISRLLALPVSPWLQVFWRVALCLQKRSTWQSGLLQLSTPVVSALYLLM